VREPAPSSVSSPRSRAIARAATSMAGLSRTSVSSASPPPHACRKTRQAPASAAPAAGYLPVSIDRNSSPVPPVNSRLSKALAVLQSRIAVTGDTLSASAVSFTVSPPKKRISTTCRAGRAVRHPAFQVAAPRMFLPECAASTEPKPRKNGLDSATACACSPPGASSRGSAGGDVVSYRDVDTAIRMDRDPCPALTIKQPDRSRHD
jgi:hypothetical protein